MGRKKPFARHYKAPFPNDVKTTEHAKPEPVPEIPEVARPRTIEEKHIASIQVLDLSGMAAGLRAGTRRK